LTRGKITSRTMPSGCSTTASATWDRICILPSTRSRSWSHSRWICFSERVPRRWMSSMAIRVTSSVTSWARSWRKHPMRAWRMSSGCARISLAFSLAARRLSAWSTFGGTPAKGSVPSPMARIARSRSSSTWRFSTPGLPGSCFSASNPEATPSAGATNSSSMRLRTSAGRVSAIRRWMSWKNSLRAALTMRCSSPSMGNSIRRLRSRWQARSKRCSPS
jgi:hypothetical protein